MRFIVLIPKLYRGRMDWEELLEQEGLQGRARHLCPLSLSYLAGMCIPTVVGNTS